jgi:uncharacterized repeat protein (TIGR01451 family)
MGHRATEAQRVSTLFQCLLWIIALQVVCLLTFAVTHTVQAAEVCTTDVGGPDDEPGQRDLTTTCVDNANLPTSLAVRWLWDDISFSGANTGDACALFDRDGDGNAEYALCVTIGGNPVALQDIRLFTCNDTRPDRCAGGNEVLTAFPSSCTVSQVGSPADTQASCTVQMTDVGGSSSSFLDTCSFPSQQPNSSPGDCILFDQDRGKLEVRKVFSPAGDPGRVNLLIDGSVAGTGTNVGNGGTTGELSVLAGNHTVGESAGTATSLNDYNSSISCRNANGTGTVVASSSGIGPLTVNVAAESDIVCTITNTRKTGSLTVIKDVVPNDATTNWAIAVSGPTPFNDTLTGDDSTGAQTVNTGSYTVVETAGANTNLADYDTTHSCTTNSTLSLSGTGTTLNITVGEGQNVVCTFVNTRKPQTGTLVVIKEVINDHGGTAVAGNFTLQVAGTAIAGNSTTFAGVSGAGTTLTVNPGTYTVSESSVAGYTGSLSTDCAGSIAAGEIKTCTVTNNDIAPQLTVIKVVENLFGPADDPDAFTLNISGSDVSQSSIQGAAAPGVTVTLDAGAYSVSETPPAGYSVSYSAGCVGTIAIGEAKSCTVTNSVQPAGIGIVKTASATLVDPGTAVTYAYTVTNQGQAPLKPVTVSDDACSPVTPGLAGGFNVGDTDQDTFLDGVEAWRFSCTSTLTQDTTNTATATGLSPLEDEVTATDTAFVDVRPTLTLSKSANPTSVPESGGDVTFTIVVTNTSAEAVTLDSLTDSQFGDLDGQGTCSAPQPMNANGGTYSCTFTQFISGDAFGTHTNVATATVLDNEENSATAQDNAVVTLTDVLPNVILTKTVEPLSRLEPGGVFTFTLLLENRSAETATITALTDSVVNPVCAALLSTEIAPNSTVRCQYPFSYSQPGDYDNTATVAVTDNEENEDTATDMATASVIDVPASIQVTKTATPTTLVEPGGTVTFTVQVENTSAVDTVTLTTVAEDDTSDGTDEIVYPAATICDVTVLAPDAIATCTFPRPVTGNAGAFFTDLATVTATDDDGQTVIDSDSANVVITNLNSQLVVTKTADPPSIQEPGDFVTFHITITNLSPVDVVTVTQLVDSDFGDITTTGHDDIVSTTCAMPQTLAINGGVYACRFVAFVDENFGDPHDNIVVASGIDDDGETVVGADEEEVVITNVPSSLVVSKTPNPAQVPENGGTVVYTVVITNTSAVDSVTLNEVIDNRLPDPISNTCTPALPVTLVPNASITCSFSQFIQGDFGEIHTNVVTANGFDDDNFLVTASASAHVTFIDTPGVLAISKSATPVQAAEGGSTIAYGIVVTNTSVADSVTVNTLGDDRFVGVDTNCAPSLPATLLPGQSISCPFSRFITGNAQETHTNIATAAGLDDDGNPVVASDDADVVFSNLPSAMTVSKSANVLGVPQAGAIVTFTVVVTNTSAVDTLTLNGLTDSIYGDVTAASNPALTDTTCLMPQSLTPSAIYICQFSALIAGQIGDEHTNVLIASGTDDDGVALEASDPETVVVTDPRIVATKRDALVIDANGDGVASPNDTISYTVVIENVGNAAALAVTLNDLVDPNTTLVAGTVTTSQGTILSGNGPNDETVAVAIGEIAPNGTVVIRFTVVVNAPLPEGVTRVANQAVASGSNFPTTPTDDPDTPIPDDPTETLVVATPDLVAAKRDSLLTDADQDGVPSPGDVLEYRIVVLNNGNQAATAVLANDILDPNLSLLPGSVATSQGTVLTGNGINDTSVAVDIGSVAGNGGTVLITFQVRIRNPLPAGVTQVSNQAFISSNELPVVPSDDPDTQPPDDPTITVVVAQPLLDASKVATLLTDADDNGVPSPGDTLLYNVTLVNTGNAEATGLVFTDTVDANTALVPGSVQSSRGTVERGNNAGDPGLTVTVGSLAGGGDQVVISFAVTINNPLPAGVQTVENQGIVHRGGQPPVRTDDPTTPQPDDPTRTVVTAQPLMTLTKVDILWIDADAGDPQLGGKVSVGDTLLYRLQLANQGNAAATNLLFQDVPDSNTQLVVGTVQATLGTVTVGNAAGDTRVEITIDALAGGETVEITFQVQILTPPADRIINQATTELDDPTSANPVVIVSDDPDTVQPNDPTTTPIAVPTGLEEGEEPDGVRSRIFLPVVNR